MHLNDPVHKSVLANGLRVVTVELGHLHAGMLAAYNRARRALFAAYPLGQKIAGTREPVSELREDDLRAHHARAYGARNLVLCAAGPFAHADIVRLAEEGFGKLPAGEQLRDPPLGNTPRGPKLVAVDHRESQTELRLSFLAPAEDAPGFAPLVLIH